MRTLLRLWLVVAAVLGAVAVPSTARAEAVIELILRLESLGRAQPAEAGRQLLQLLPATTEFGAERLELLTVLGLAHAHASRTDAAEAAALPLEAWSKAPAAPLANRAAAAAQLIRATSAARGGNNMPRADALMKDALARLPKAAPPRERYRYALAQAYTADRSGRLEDAVRHGHEALALADQIDVPWRRSEARTGLAYSYFGAKQLERARTLSQEALALAEEAQDGVALARAHNISGIVLDSLGDLAGERRSFELAIAASQLAGSKIDEVRYRANLADFFLKNGEFKTALAQAERALPLARELNDASSEMVALANMGLAHISMQHLEQGKRLVSEAIAIDERRGETSSVADTLLELGSYLEKAGDLAGAVAAYHRHRQLAAGILRDADQRAILSMQEQYDADRRARELELLNREQQVKNEQLHRHDLEQRLGWLLVAVFVLAFAAIALLYRRVRQTHRLLTSSNEMLKMQSERDPLTGLSNRRHFQAVMRHQAGNGSFSGTACLIDIDHFKHINDSRGHAVGDAVLVEVGRRLRETLRDDDLIVRWGGEEFLVVVPSLDAEPVDALVQRLLKTLDASPVVVDGRGVAVTASIGHASFPIGPAAQPVAWERAIKLVDAAMYLAKAHGRNRAYGVRLLQAGDDAALDAIAEDLQAASQDGRVALTLLQGRAPMHLQVAA
jgi:diguanylate cyclase (GGDEF)-like protein